MASLASDGQRRHPGAQERAAQIDLRRYLQHGRKAKVWIVGSIGVRRTTSVDTDRPRCATIRRLGRPTQLFAPFISQRQTSDNRVGDTATLARRRIAVRDLTTVLRRPVCGEVRRPRPSRARGPAGPPRTGVLPVGAGWPDRRPRTTRVRRQGAGQRWSPSAHPMRGSAARDARTTPARPKQSPKDYTTVLQIMAVHLDHSCPLLGVIRPSKALGAGFALRETIDRILDIRARSPIADRCSLGQRSRTKRRAWSIDLIWSGPTIPRRNESRSTETTRS